MSAPVKPLWLSREPRLARVRLLPQARAGFGVYCPNSDVKLNGINDVETPRLFFLHLEDLSREPTFFVNKRVFAMFSNNHHGDGHVAVWVPAPPGLQQALVEEGPETYYRPPYAGSSGWVGIELDQVGEEVLVAHLQQAHQLISMKKRK